MLFNYLFDYSSVFKQKIMGNNPCQCTPTTHSSLPSVPTPKQPIKQTSHSHDQLNNQHSLLQQASTPLTKFIAQHQHQQPICASNNLPFNTLSNQQLGNKKGIPMKMGKVMGKKENSQTKRCSIDIKNIPQFQITMRNLSTFGSEAFSRIQISQEKFIHLRNEDVKKYYKYQQIIGEGSFGSVYRAVSLKSKEERAIKIIRKDVLSQARNDKKEEVFSQLQLLKKMDHPNIIKLYEVFQSNQRYHVVTQYCRGGSIIDFIKKRRLFDQNVVKVILKQLLGCANYLHTLNIVHRDIKLQNIVFIGKVREHKANDIEIKLLDFGTAYKMTASKVRCSQLIGTISYIAPEIIQGYFTDKCDLWGCGVILYILLTSRSPFKCKSKQQTLQMILTHQIDYDDGLWDDISYEAQDLVRNLLQKDPQLRFSAQEALQHEWFHKQSASPKDNEFIKNLSNYYRENNLISVLESYLVFSKVNQEQRKRINLLFKQLDRNSDGAIQKSQLIQAYKQANTAETNLDQIEHILQKIDKDKTGSISLNQFSSVMVNRAQLFVKQALEQAFDYFANGTGFIELSTLSQLLEGSDSKEIDLLLGELDENEDRRVSKQQFLQYLLRKGCLY